MRPAFTRITRGSELAIEEVVWAIASRENAAALFGHLATISKPKQGSAKLLVLLARLVDAAWVEGDLRVELADEDGVTVIDVLSDAGGVRERVFRRARFGAPMAEFVAAVERFPFAVAPLLVKRSNERCAVFTSGSASRHASLPPKRIEIDAGSMTDYSSHLPVVFVEPDARRSRPVSSGTRVDTKSFEVCDVRRALVNEVKRGGRSHRAPQAWDAMSTPGPRSPTLRPLTLADISERATKSEEDGDVDGGWE